MHAATCDVLGAWTERLRREAGEKFSAKVTAFHAEMVVHGKSGQPCTVCGTTVQRIVSAENEVNYFPRCQTGGRVLADRSLSRLPKSDWPRTIGMLQLMLAGGLCFRRTRISAAVALAAIVMIAIANQWRNDRIDAQSSLQAAVCAWALIVAWGEARRARALAPG